jgi:hypothetical protein
VRKGTSIRKRQKQQGVALLIAIFVLLLIGVIGIALVISSGTESALAGNYRSSTSVQYAAVAGVEEVRARLRPNSPNSFGTTDPGFIPTPLGTCNPVYVLNPLGGEAVTPWDPASPLYYDNEFGQEFGAICGGGPGGPPPNPSPTANSIWNRAPLSGLPFPGPSYKWVRINGVSEQSLHVDTWPLYDGISANLIYYDGTHLLDTNSGYQVYELTALAVLPNGSRKLVQYLVAPAPLNMPPFLAALTIPGKPGNSVAFSAPTTNASYSIKGIDQPVGACAPGLPVHAVGVFNSVDQGNVIVGGNGGTGIPAAYQSNYAGTSPAPDVQDISALFPASLSSPVQLEALIQTIIQNADVVINGPATGASLPSSMYSPIPNPMTIVVNGDLDLNAWHNTGYGLLLVRGNLNYDPDASWNGIVMVVGQGTVTGTKGGVGEFDGAFFLAKTLDAAGNILSPNFGTATMLYGNSMGSNGIRYSSCWIQKSQPTSGYKILSFHEISQ